MSPSVRRKRSFPPVIYSRVTTLQANDKRPDQCGTRFPPDGQALLVLYALKVRPHRCVRAGGEVSGLLATFGEVGAARNAAPLQRGRRPSLAPCHGLSHIPARDKPRHDFLAAGAELSRLSLVCICSASDRAAWRHDEALNA
jgi:hypothetical protein